MSNGLDMKSSIKSDYNKQNLSNPPPKYFKLPDKDDNESELREYKDKDRQKVKCK